MSPIVQTITSNAVASIVIERPPVNALGPDHWSELRRQVDDTNADASVRALVITGGSGRFCAGADISTLVESTRAEPSDDPALMLRLVANVASAIRSHHAPVIASIDGPAHGGGLEIALACDLRIASPAATFAASGVNMGLIASVRSLVRTIGSTHARRMLLTGDRIDAATADRWGLVSHFDEQPDRRSEELAQAMASKAPLAIEATKRALNTVDSLDADEHDELMTELFSNLVRSSDHAEAINAFLEKRRPVFTRD